MLYPIQDFDGIKQNFIEQKNETMFVDINWNGLTIIL